MMAASKPTDENNPGNSMDVRYIPTREAAALLGRETNTLWKWAYSGTGPIKPVRIAGRLMWPIDEVQFESKSKEERLLECVLPAWQTAAAIAQHAGMRAQAASIMLKANATKWQLEQRTVRVDGHNLVSMFRRRPMRMVMGVMVPTGESE